MTPPPPTAPDRPPTRRLVRWFLAIAGCVALVLMTVALTLRFRPEPTPSAAAADPAVARTERRLEALATELTELRRYNDRLRTALGDERPETPGVPARDLPERSGRSRRADGAVDFSLDDSPGERAARRRSSERDLRRALADTEGDPDAGPIETLPGESAPDAGLMQLAARWDARTADAATALDLGLPALAPVQGVVTRGFDPAAGHYGIDFAARVGRPVKAVADGVVLFSGWTAENGHMIVIQHPGGYVSAYWHNRATLKRTRDRVRKGELVAESGDTGSLSTGPHLHFELWRAGVALDPRRYLLDAGPASEG